MIRRDLLKNGAASAALIMLLSRAQAIAAAATANPEETRLAVLFERMMMQNLDRSPETVTGLGLDHGARLSAKRQLDDRSIAAWHSNVAMNRAQLAELKQIDRARLTGLNRSNYDSVLFDLTVQDDISRTIPYIGNPYVISQLTGAYQSVPDFLDSQHQIENTYDAQAYLDRLRAFAVAIDQESERVRHDLALGISPPDFILTKALIQMKALRDAPIAEQNLVQSLVRRAKAKAIAGDWNARAATIFQTEIVPALTRQIALIEGLVQKARHTAGAAALPDGAAFYRLSLRQYTTSTLAPADIHQIGLDLIARQTAEIDTILAAQGITGGTVGERLHRLYLDPQYQYANTDSAKEVLIADLNKKIAQITVRLPAYFGTLPKAKLDIRRVPKAIEAGAPGGYYNSGSLDGSRPGAFYINLRDSAEVPRWVLPTLVFHEGIPGHHLQGSLAQETSLPTIRKIQFFSGYGEGWALYAEQLAVEMGMYADDPLGHVGQLHDAMFRSVRLVVDSGMHAMGWSREQAIAFYVTTLGSPETEATTEVERYCVWPGQACSYMLGKIEWLRLRDKAKAALGNRFDIRTFHDAGLLAGAMPLPVLATRIEDFITESGGKS